MAYFFDETIKNDKHSILVTKEPYKVIQKIKKNIR